MRSTSTARSTPALPRFMPGARGWACRPSRRACSIVTTPDLCGPAARSISRHRIAWPPSTSGWRVSAPSSGRTCWRPRRLRRWCWRRGTLPACTTPRAGPAGKAAQPPAPRAPFAGEAFLQFSARRDLREKVFQAWIRRGENGGTTDNRALIAEMVALRAERAKLLGFASFADYRLADQMAKTPQAARHLLAEGWGRPPPQAHP